MILLKYLVNRGQKIIKHISIRERIIIFFLIFTLTPVLIIGSISYNCLENVVTEKIVRYSLAELAQTVVNIQLKLAEYETISLQLFINKDFNTILENYVDTPNGLPNSSIQMSVETYFNDYMTNNKDLFGFMFIGDSDDYHSIVVTKDLQKDFICLSKNYKSTSACRSILKANGGIVWSTTIKINRSNFIILGRAVKRLSNGKPLGILALIIDEGKIDQLVNLTTYNELNNSLDNIGNYALIINGNGEIVSSPFKEDIRKKVSQIMGNNIPLRSFIGDSLTEHKSYIDHGSFITNVNGKQSLVTYKAIGSKNGIGGKSGWYLVNLAPASVLYEERQVVTVTTLILCLVFGALAIWFSFYVANIIFHDQRPKPEQ
jgi:two-component system sensor histidine kinase YesM